MTYIKTYMHEDNARAPWGDEARVCNVMYFNIYVKTYCDIYKDIVIYIKTYCEIYKDIS